MYKKSKVTSRFKLRHFSPKIWRIAYLIKSNPIHHSSEKRLWNTSSHIPNLFLNNELLIYSGKNWHTRRVNSWNIGFRAGSLVWTKKPASYKTKQSKKKK